MLIQRVPNYCTYLFIDFLKLKLTKSATDQQVGLNSDFSTYTKAMGT